MTLQEQRNDLEKASRFLEAQIKELTFKKQVLINAFNSIDANKEDILHNSNSLVAQEARNIMREINYKII